MRIRTIRISDHTFDVGPVTSSIDPQALVRYTRSTDEYHLCLAAEYDWQHARIDMGADSPVQYLQIYWTDHPHVCTVSPEKLFFDMDGVLCDFEAAAVAILDAKGVPRDHPEYKQMVSDCQDIPGFYRNLPPIVGAIESFKALTRFYDCYICSAPSWTNPTSWTDKYHWVVEHIGGDFAYKRLILTHDKGMFSGRALIDDRVKYNVPAFTGEHVMFGNSVFPDWPTVFSYLTPKAYSEGVWINQHTGQLRLTIGDRAEELRIAPELMVLMAMVAQFGAVDIGVVATQAFGRDTPYLRGMVEKLIDEFDDLLDPRLPASFSEYRAKLPSTCPSLAVIDGKVTRI